MLAAGSKTDGAVHLALGGYLEPADREGHPENTQYYDVEGNWVGNRPPRFSSDPLTLPKLLQAIPQLWPTAALDWEEQINGQVKWCVISPDYEDGASMPHFDTPNLALCHAILIKSWEIEQRGTSGETGTLEIIGPTGRNG